MAIHKFIYRRPDYPVGPGQHPYINIALLIGYTNNKLEAFHHMATLIKADLPFINVDDIEFGKVYKSERYKGYTIATWHGRVPNETKFPDDWIIHPECDPDYYW